MTSEIKEGKDVQRIAVFQQNGSAEAKIAGLRLHGGDLFELTVISIDQQLPLVLEDGREFLPARLDVDLVLDYLTHQDLSHDLVALCAQWDIPVVSSGKKIPGKKVMTPPTCCGLARQACLGKYGEMFGGPEFEVEIEDGRVKDVQVVRGAPCAATWEAAAKIIGSTVEDAAREIGLKTQFYCSANPAGWDPIYGKSPVHFAGKVHSRALAQAIDRAIKKESS